LTLFFSLPKKSRLQLARHELFTKEEKTSHLYDTGGFAFGGAMAHFQRNLLQINMIGEKIGRRGPGQNRVTYNNMLLAGAENRCFFPVCGRAGICWEN
jgi:hypothetical protein